MAKIANRQDVLVRHKRDVIWQIWVPVGFGAIAVLALGFMAAFSLQTGTEASVRWGHVAAIWLILPFFLIGFLILILIVGLTALVFQLRGHLPDYALVIQYYVEVAADRIHSIADKSVQPIINTRSTKAAVNRFWLALRYLLMGGYRD